MRALWATLIVGVCGCSDAPVDHWLRAIGGTTAIPRTITVEGDRVEISLRAWNAGSLAGFTLGGDELGRTDFKAGYPIARLEDGTTIVAGGGTRPFIERLDTGGALRWIREWPLSTGVSTDVIPGASTDGRRFGTHLALVVKSRSAAAAAGAPSPNFLAVLDLDGTVSGTAPLDLPDIDPLGMSLDPLGLTLAYSDPNPPGYKLTIASFDWAAKPRWSHTFEGTTPRSFGGIASCPEGVVLYGVFPAEDLGDRSAGPHLIRYDTEGHVRAMRTISDDGAIACDETGVVTVGRSIVNYGPDLSLVSRREGFSGQPALRAVALHEGSIFVAGYGIARVAVGGDTLSADQQSFVARLQR